jgi:hypothetical protein
VDRTLLNIRAKRKAVSIHQRGDLQVCVFVYIFEVCRG